jgi:hypothetical protein
LKAEADITYRIDDVNRLIAVGGAWDEFALANGAAELVAPAPLGRGILEFIADHATAHIYQELFLGVRHRGRSTSFPIRCDSAGVRRHLQVTIALADGGDIAVTSRVLRIERRSLEWPSAEGADHTNDHLNVCGWCKRFDVQGGWLEIEDAIPLLAIFDWSQIPDTSHGICDDCARQMEGVLAEP